MTFVAGKNAKVLLGKYDMSAFFNSADLTWDVDGLETTVFGDIGDRSYTAGLRTATISMSGFWSHTSSNTPDEVVPTQLGATAVNIISYAPSGLAHGSPVYSGQSRWVNYSVSNPVDGIVGVSLDANMTERLSQGFSLHNLSAVTSDSSGNPLALTSNTSSGGIGYLHVTNVTLPATGQLVITIQDSPTCSAGSWADLITFTTITCSVGTAERKTVTGNIDAYARAEWSFTGGTSGTATFHVNFQQL